MRKSALLLGVLLVVVAFTASGCLGGLGDVIGGIIGGLQDDTAVRTTVQEFLTAWNQRNAQGMESRLASQVTFEQEAFGETEGVVAGDELADGLLGPDDAMQVVEVAVVGSIGAWVDGDDGTASANVRVKYELIFGDRALPVGDDPWYIEDIYPMAFGLRKDGSGWRINQFTMQLGERMTAIRQSWTTFAEGMVEGNVDDLLSVTTDPFVWSVQGGSPFDGVETHAEWRALLEDVFDERDFQQFELNGSQPMYLDAEDGLFYGLLSVEDIPRVAVDPDPDPQPDGDLLFIHVTYDAGMWKLSRVDVGLNM